MARSFNIDVDHAIVELADASEQLSQAQSRVVDARRAEVTALNRVNEAQKKFDELVATLKKASPRDTDWRRWEMAGPAG